MAGYIFPKCVDCGNNITNFKYQNKQRCTSCYDKRVREQNLLAQMKKKQDTLKLDGEY